MSRSKTPIIAIVGQTNVGKSSLFNVFLGRREAIVAREAGTTRDSITALVQFGSKPAWIVDTAGVKDPEDDFEATIQEQIEQAIDAADMIAVTIQADLNISDDDRRLAKSALKSKKPVILLVNKADKAHRAAATYYQRLGIKDIFLTSATTKEGIGDLEDYLAKHLPASSMKRDDSSRLRIALLGRPNAGKSALYNTLAKKQQAVVSERAGTTRDVNRTVVRYHGQEIELLDTAGIRRSGKIEQGIEKFSVLRSLRAIEEADVCLLLSDANELGVVLDQKIAGMVKQAGKGLVLVASKWDTVEKDAYTRDALAPKIRHYFDFVPWAPLIFTSSVTGQNVSKLFELAQDIQKERQKKLKDSELNRWLKRMCIKHPPAGLKNTHPRLTYITRIDEYPTPTFKIFGSDMKFLHWSYKRFLEREMREAYGFDGTAIYLDFIEKDRKDYKNDKS